MPLNEKWAFPEDFATLFQYLWYRDFPIDQKATGAKRADWTIHIGLVVRKIADLMGLAARFESGKRTDAVLRSTDGDEIAIEWEWGGVWGNELEKLKLRRRVWAREKGSKKLLRYAVLITYTHTPNIEKVYDRIVGEWKGAQWPLLLILVDVAKSPIFSTRKEFKNIQASIFDTNGVRGELRIAPAFPWRVSGTRWSYQMK